jgi:hypothetical protein
LDTINNQTIENNNRYSEKIIYQIINLKEFQNYLKVFKNVLHEGNVLESENNFKNLYKYEIDNINRDNEDIFYYVNDYFDSGFEDIFLREKGSRIIEPTPVIEIKINNETNCFTETANNLVINDSKVNDEIFCLYKDFPEIAIYDVVKKLELLSTVKHVKINRNIINLLSHILILSIFEENRKKLNQMDILSYMQAIFDNIIDKYFNSDSIFHSIINNDNNTRNINSHASHNTNSGSNNNNIDNYNNNYKDKDIIYECVIYILAIFIKFNHNNQPWKKYIENWIQNSNNQDSLTYYSSISFKQKQQLLKSLIHLLYDLTHYRGIVINQFDSADQVNLSDKELSSSPLSVEFNEYNHTKELSIEEYNIDFNEQMFNSINSENSIESNNDDKLYEIQHTYIIKMLGFSLIGEMILVNTGLTMFFDQHQGFELLMEYLQWPYFLKEEYKDFYNSQYNPNLMDFIQYEFHIQILSWRIINYLITVDMQKYAKKLEISSKTVNPLTNILEWVDFVTNVRYNFINGMNFEASDESLEFQNDDNYNSSIFQNFKSFMSVSSSTKSRVNLFSSSKSSNSYQAFQFYPKNLLIFPVHLSSISDENNQKFYFTSK